MTKNLTMTALVDLLQTQGTVSSLARPRVAMLSGASSKFRVGSTTAYVSKIARSQNTQGSSDSTVTSSSETAEVKTGFELSMRGSYQEGTVYTNLEMTISELVRFNETVQELFIHELSDTYNAEKQMTRSLPKMISSMRSWLSSMRPSIAAHFRRATVNADGVRLRGGGPPAVRPQMPSI